MKTIKLLFLSLFLLNFMGIRAQTYCFSAPQGFGAGTTGGGSGPVTIVTTKAQLQAALTASGNGVVIVSGSVQCDYLSVLVTNKTLLGLPGANLFTNDQTAGASGILYIKAGSDNVIIRNLVFVGPGAYDTDGRDDLTNEGTRVWVDHCEFQDGMDGNFDNKGACDNVTVSWCKFTYLKPPKAGGSGGTDDHRFSNLVSSSDSDYPSDGSRNMTWQYCWWAQGCVERMVRARNATLHQLNCYWNSSVTNKCIGLSAGDKGCSDYVESGVFAASGTVADLSYGGSPTIAFVNCTGGGSNVGTVNKPSYSYEVTPVGSLVSAITGTCGAGATLQVTTAGVVSASCGTSNVAVSSVSLSPTSSTITSANGTVQLTATIAPSNATNKNVTWASSNTTVATVSSTGLVTGLSNGSATITVTTADGSKKATCAITVNISTTTVAVTGVAVSPTSVSVPAGSTTTLVATISPSNATNKSVSWTSNNTVAATVSSSGVVTGIAAGSATITVTTADGAKTATCAVTVTAVASTTVVRIEDSATSSTGLCSYDGALKAYSGASNGYAINLSNSTAKGINWKVEVAAAGTFTLTWRYVNGSTSAATSAKLIVNGTTVNSSVSFPRTVDKSTFVTTATTAAFIKGVNEIRLETTSGSEFADIDWIEVSGGNLVVANCSSAVGSSVVLKSEDAINGVINTESSKMAIVYPNPFAGSTTINFALDKKSNVQIDIYDLNGKLVAAVVDAIFNEGDHQITYNNSVLKSGIYILSITSGSSKQNIRLVVQ